MGCHAYSIKKGPGAQHSDKQCEAWLGGRFHIHHKPGLRLSKYFFSTLDIQGDLSMSPAQLIDRGISITAQAHTLQGDRSTCTVGGMIGCFLTQDQNQCPVEHCSMIKSTPIKPHYPIQIMVNKRPHLTKVLEPVGAKKSLDAEPMHF